MVKKFNCVCEKGSHYSTNQVKKCRRAHGLDKKAPIISKKKVVSQGAPLKDLRSRVIIMNSHNDNVLKHGNLQRYLDSDYQRTPAIQRANAKYLRLCRASTKWGARNQKTPTRVKKFFKAYNNALCCLVRMFIFNKQFMGCPRARSMSAAWNYITKHQQTKEFGKVSSEKLTQDQRDFQNLIRDFPTQILLFRRCLEFEQSERRIEHNWIETDLECFGRMARQTWWRQVAIQPKDTTPYKLPKVDANGDHVIDQQGNIIFEVVKPKPGLMWDINRANVKAHCTAVFEKIWFFQSQRRHYSPQFILNYYAQNKTRYLQFKQPWDAVKVIALRLEGWLNQKYGHARCYDWSYGQFVGAKYLKSLNQHMQQEVKQPLALEEKVIKPLTISPQILEMQNKVEWEKKCAERQRLSGYAGDKMFKAIKNEWIKIQNQRLAPIRRLIFGVLPPIVKRTLQTWFNQIKQRDIL